MASRPELIAELVRVTRLDQKARGVANRAAARQLEAVQELRDLRYGFERSALQILSAQGRPTDAASVTRFARTLRVRVHRSRRVTRGNSCSVREAWRPLASVQGGNTKENAMAVIKRVTEKVTEYQLDPTEEADLTAEIEDLDEDEGEGDDEADDAPPARRRKR